ncbi:MAG: hypothetical protein JJ858_13935 [Rhizobiaceae bacterium]|nr:hypothetical protein [Rhizobiaceae bacterium]
MEDKTVLRARDFWTSLVLMATSIFFIYKTTDIPFFNTKSAGVDVAEWYNSAALVPYGIFYAMLILSVVLMFVSIKDGGAERALSLMGLGFTKDEALRITSVSAILLLYIFGLVPRVDFIIGSALMITCLIWGFHKGDQKSMLISVGAIAIASLYALIAHFPRSEWTKPHDDDWVTLLVFAALSVVMFIKERRANALDKIVKLTPVISILVPTILVCAMAFGFRQNVPNRQGLIFSHIEYHYFVTIKPLWQGQ